MHRYHVTVNGVIHNASATSPHVAIKKVLAPNPTVHPEETLALKRGEYVYIRVERIK